MYNRLGARWTRAGLTVLASVLTVASAADAVNILEIDTVQTAGISAQQWDRTFPGVMRMDAIGHPVLLRFPGAADAIAARLADGFAIQRAEVLLDYAGHETAPSRYTVRVGLMRPKVESNPPRWHVIAQPLRRPWIEDAERGPTFNAAIKGVRYWERFGATGQGDRHELTFDAVELSEASPEASIEVTPLLTEPPFGADLGQRLRAFEEQGILLRKRETYDHRYDEWWSAYEWGVPTGGNALSFANPRLQVTFSPAPAIEVRLPQPTDVDALADHAAEDGPAGEPTAVMPTDEELRAMAAQGVFRQPDWMPDWQWERVRELRDIGGGVRWSEAFQTGDPELYARTITNILRMPLRYFRGWELQDELLLWYLYRDVLPAPVQDHLAAYWDSWLMPDIPTQDFFHAQSRENLEYQQNTEDWRGRKSFFRGGYNYTISTMNFNHTAAMGALLGGAVIGSDRVMKDGRHGLEYLPLRLWSWYDGTTGESIDHYYFSITLSGQKMFADFGPTPLDRLMGQSILAKSVEELTSLWHPGLKRFISPSGRTALSHLWVSQGGLEHIVHTLSPAGTLHDVDNDDIFGMDRYDQNAPAGRIALQTMAGPWAPEWAANMVDQKPLPYRMTTSYKQWGHFSQAPLWKRTYLGEHHGVASVDIDTHGSVPVMAQWRRAPQPVENVQDIGTLLVRYGHNETRMLTQHGGVVTPQVGLLTTLQHDNALIVLGTPSQNLGNVDPDDVTSLQTTVGLFSFEATPGWELFVDGARVEDLPVRLEAGQRITLRDGVSFVGIVPLPSTDLGRRDEIVIHGDAPVEQLQGGGEAAPTLVINQYNYQSARPLSEAGIDSKVLDQATGGFIIKVSDTSEVADFAAFQSLIDGISMQSEWDRAGGTLSVAADVDGDRLEMQFRPAEYRTRGLGAGGFMADRVLPYRRVNGEWPYLPRGLDRDTDLTQMGTGGRLEKNGAVLTCEPGRMAYLQTEPITETYAGFNPLPDPTLWALSLPGGARIEADGRVGLMRVIARPSENRLSIDYALKPGQTGDHMASELLVFGFDRQPVVEINAQAGPRRLSRVRVGRERAWRIPLPDAPERRERARALTTRLESVRETLARRLSPEGRALFVHDWYVIGPFPNHGHALWRGGHPEYPPEQAPIDLTAAFTGMPLPDDEDDVREAALPGRLENDREKVFWQRLPLPESGALAEGGVDLAAHLTPNRAAVAYAYTVIESDRDREVYAYTGSDRGIAVWVNGDKVWDRNIFRGAAPDTDRFPVKLAAGRNEVLLRQSNGHEGFVFFFRLGDSFGLPVTDGLRFGFAAEHRLP